MTVPGLDFSIPTDLTQDIRGWRSRAMIAGGIGALALFAGLFVNPFQFYRSYLWAYVFCLGTASGCMAWLMLQYLTSGAWGVVIRRPAEAAARTFPLLAVMFVPIIIGIPNLYEWSHKDVVAKNANLQHKAAYLNVPFFIGRAAFYFAGWMLIAYLLNKWSAREDRDGGGLPNHKMHTVSAPGLIFWCLSITFMAIDWMLSLNPEWFSTIFGMLMIAGQGLGSMAFLITVLVALSARGPMNAVLTHRHLHDLGKFLLALTMVWAYFSYSQFLIIWAGNLPEEIPWYLTRLNGGWGYVAIGLVVGHFALPFALLLSRDIKRNFKLLRRVAIFIMCMRMVDLYWVIAPDFRKDGFGISWMDLAAPVGLFGIWLSYFFLQLEKRPLMPLNAPNLVEALEHGRE